MQTVATWRARTSAWRAAQLALALLRQHLFGGFARFALMAQVAAALDHAAQHVVGQLDSAHVEAFLDTQQPPIDQRRERVGRGARGGEVRAQAFLGDVLAEARVGEQLVLDDPAHGRRLVGQRAFVEIAEDGVVGAGEQIQRDFARAPARCACR